VPEELVQIGFRGTVEYRANLARAALDRKIKVQEMLDLETRNENAIRAVTSNLEVFSEYATIKGAPPPGKTHKARRAAK
jgi:hypothetical protein